MNDNTTAFNISNAKNNFFGRRLCPFWLLTAYIFYYSILGWRRFRRPAFFYLGQRLCNFHIIFRHCLSFVTSRLITTVFFGAVKSPTCSYNSPEILVWRRFRLPAFFYLGQRLRNCHIIFRHCIAEKLLLAESVLFFRSVEIPDMQQQQPTNTRLSPSDGLYYAEAICLLIIKTELSS